MTVSAYLGLCSDDSWIITHRCANEVLVAAASTPLSFARQIPSAALSELRFRTTTGACPPNHVENGQLMHSFAVQGIHRLTAESAALLDRLLAFPPGSVVTTA